MTDVVANITVGSRYYDLTTYTYYGYDSGPNLYYGDVESSGILGNDNKEYTIHGVRWAAESPTSRVYLRLDNPTIQASDGYTAYSNIFSSITIGSTTLLFANIIGGFTVDGGVAFYWARSTNPFGSVGSITQVTFSGVSGAPYGLEVYNSTGKLVISITSRLPRFVATGTVRVNAGQSTNVFISGLQNNDSWDVIVSTEPISSNGIVLASSAVYSGYFTISNNDAYDSDFTYWVLRT